MNTAATATPVANRRINPAIEIDTAARNPTATRYGWNPFRPINLAGPDGTMAYVVQPERIEGPEGPTQNPYHRELPVRQLIPFETFTFTKYVPTAGNDPNTGRTLLRAEREIVTALDAITAIAYGYSSWGFTILDSLQGVDQDLAYRVFQVVQPLAYPLRQMQAELEANVDARIESRRPITFKEFPDYEVEPLRDEAERDLARRVANELSAGADRAVIRANTILDETEASMTQKFSGGNGKSGPDELDRTLAEELGRELPRLVGKDNQASTLERKIDNLTEKVELSEARRELAEARAELEALRSGTPQASVAADMELCGRPTSSGAPCKARSIDGGPCRAHQE